MSAEQLATSDAENFLTLLAWNDQHCHTVRASISVDLFESSVYRRIVGEACAFIDEYKQPPKDHLPDLLEDVLQGDDKTAAEQYGDILHGTQALAKTINVQFALDRLQHFIRRQKLSQTVIEVQGMLEADAVDDAEQFIQRTMRELRAGDEFVADDMDDLLRTEYTEAECVVEPILPKGLVLITGRPKSRKSFTLQHIAEAVRCGGKVFDRYTVPNKAGVLYLALEDNARRISKRGKIISKPFYRILKRKKGYVFYDWPRGDVERLRRFLDEHPDVQLVVIDTLAKFRKPGTKGENAYMADVYALAELQRLAQERGITVAVVHHSRKMEADDVLDTVSGTTGLTGTADSIWVMKVERGSDDGTLFIDGRDHDESLHLQLQWDTELTAWRVMGDFVERPRLGAERQKVLDNLDQEGKTIEVIADELGKEYHATRKHLVQLAIDGLATKLQDGRYTRP